MARIEADLAGSGQLVWNAGKPIFCSGDRVVCGVEVELHNVSNVGKGYLRLVVEVVFPHVNRMDFSGWLNWSVRRWLCG